MTITSLLLHSHKKRRYSLKTRAVLLIFSLEISGVAVQSIHQKTTKNSNFCEENDFEAVLAILSCYEHGAKASEAVQKIATDQKEYCKCSLCVIIF